VTFLKTRVAMALAVWALGANAIAADSPPSDLRTTIPSLQRKVFLLPPVAKVHSIPLPPANSPEGSGAADSRENPGENIVLFPPNNYPYRLPAVVSGHRDVGAKRRLPPIHAFVSEPGEDEVPPFTEEDEAEASPSDEAAEASEEAEAPEQAEENDEDEEGSEAGEATGGEAEEKEPLGEAPEDTSQVFLRQSTVLLGPGELQMDIGFVYAMTETDSVVILSDQDVALGRIRDRQFLVPIGIRYGLVERTELFGVLPVGVGFLEIADPEQVIRLEEGGLADVGAGIKYVLLEEQGESPDIVVSVDFTAPTGRSALTLTRTAPQLGSGLWSVGAGVNAIKSYDPLVLFAGLGYRHEFEGNFSGISVQRGEILSYSLGMGFAVNPYVTLSADFQGIYQGATRIDGVEVPDSTFEPMSLRLSVIRRTRKGSFVEPFVRFGLTSDAADAQFGLFFTRNFGGSPCVCAR
jgi:hypothetical protein